MMRIIFCALAASLIVAGASAAHAHIPTKCATHVQELQWALEGQDDTQEHVDLAVEVGRDIRPALVKQYARISRQVRHKALLLVDCIVEPPSVE